MNKGHSRKIEDLRRGRQNFGARRPPDTKGSGEYLELLLLVRMDVKRVAAKGRRPGQLQHRGSGSSWTATARVVRLSFRISHSAARQAIIVRTSTGRSAKANAVAATGSPSRHMVMKRAATVAAHRETTRANRRLTLPSSLPSSCPRSCCAV